MEATPQLSLFRLPQSQLSVLVLVAVAVAGVTMLHYLTGAHLLEYHTVYRSLYYLPIAGAAVAFGLRGGLAVAVIVIALFSPHVLGFGEMMPGGMLDNLLELPVFVLVGGLVGALADRERTQRRRAEGLRAYIDAVLQSLPVGVATAAASGSPVAQNAAARMLLATLSPRTDLAALRPGYHTLEQGSRPLGLYVAPFREGDTAEQVYVLEDQTERRALEAQLRRVDRLASLGQLAAGVAHEVRNPLAIVRATAQLLAAQLGANDSLQRFTQVLTSEADRIERLISHLLEYARPRPPVPTPLDLDHLLETSARQVQPYAAQRGVSVMVERRVSALLQADEAQLGQALLNLLLNAVQASAPGSTVQLVGEQRADATIITVIDHGRGMASAELERACDPFFTTRPEGTGLGLALVAAVVQEHGGTLQLTSAVGEGTRATISLPRADHLVANGTAAGER
jgi:signal transduction histidine kinase